MARGFFKGMFWGAGCSLGAVLLLSIAAGSPPDRGLSPKASQPATLLSGRAVQPAARTGAGGPSIAGLAGEDIPAPEPDTLAGLLSETLAPAAVPQAGQASDLTGAQLPEGAALSGIARPDTARPRVTYTGRGALQTPATEPGLSISTDPAQPMTSSDAVTGQTPFAGPKTGGVSVDPESPAEEIAARPTFSTQVATPPSPRVADEATSITMSPAQPVPPAVGAGTSGFGTAAAGRDQSGEQSGEEQQTAGAAREETMAALAPEPRTPAPQAAAPSVVSDAPAQPAPLEVASVSVASDPPMDNEPDRRPAAELPVPETVAQATEEGESASARVSAELSVAEPEADGQRQTASAISAPSIAPGPEPREVQSLSVIAVQEVGVAPDTTQPAAPPAAPEMAQSAEVTVRVNRLPTTQDETEPETADETADDLPVAAVEEEAALPVERPFDRFAVGFENVQNKPLMAVVLMDDGVDMSDPKTGLGALRDLPYPISFAIDTLLPDAAPRAAAYRAAGFEVLAMVDLPGGATATDAEVNLSVALNAIPDAVGVLEGVRTGVQTTPEAGRQVAQILAQTGHGFVTQNRGLNTVQKLAARGGVPSAVVFREFDGQGQTSDAIRRLLDQAAFRAGQEGGVVMLGRLRKETLSALMLWALQDRASSIAMAPVTAVLDAQ